MSETMSETKGRGKYTFFMIDVDNGVVVAIWSADDPVPASGGVHEATKLARETGRRYSIARSVVAIEDTK